MSQQCPHYSEQKKSSDNYKVNIYAAPRPYLFSHLVERVRRVGWESLCNAWKIGKQNNFSQSLIAAHARNKLIDKMPLPVGSLYLTADQKIMRALLKPSRRGELFSETQNGLIFIKKLIKVIMPEVMDKYSIDEIYEKFLLTASVDNIDELRAPIIKALNNIKSRKMEVIQIADEILDAIPHADYKHCDTKRLATEYVVTVFCKLILNLNMDKENYAELAATYRLISLKVDSGISHRPLEKGDAKNFEQVAGRVKFYLDKIIQCSPFVKKLQQQGWDDIKIRLNIFIFLFAGYETTASSLNYLLWQLGRKQNNCYQKQFANPETHENAISQFCSEGLRLHPAVFMIGREFKHDTIIELIDNNQKTYKKFKLLKGHSILCLPQIAALDSHSFADPLTFNPERFAKNSQKLAWLPFGSGVHACPGKHLARLELECFLSRLSNKFKVETIEPENNKSYGFGLLQSHTAKVKLSPI